MKTSTAVRADEATARELARVDGDRMQIWSVGLRGLPVTIGAASAVGALNESCRGQDFLQL